jgi:hypothetical protein
VITDTVSAACDNESSETIMVSADLIVVCEYGRGACRHER